jgi:hypothetical protein
LQGNDPETLQRAEGIKYLEYHVVIAVFIWKRPDSHNDETSSEYRAG